MPVKYMKDVALRIFVVCSMICSVSIIFLEGNDYMISL